MLGNVHAPQLAMRPPQPSPAGPQAIPRDPHVAGTHLGGCPHAPPTPPPPHVSPGLLQVPHESEPPHPFPAGPQVIPRSEQVKGTHGLPPSGIDPPVPQTPGLV